MSKLLDQDAFAACIEAATRLAGFTVEGREGLNVYVTQHGKTRACNLREAYQAYQDSPDRLDEIVVAHLRVLENVPLPSPLPSEKEASESLLPLLQQTRLLKEARQKNIVPIFSRPFIKGVVITYIFNFPQYSAYVHTDIWAQMTLNGRVPDETIHQCALENLRLHTTADSYETFGVGNKTMIVSQTQDGYAATRVLLPELMEKWAKRIPGRMLIGIPNRHYLIAFGDRHPSRGALTRQIRRDAKRGQDPLSKHLLIWENGKIREYRRH